MKKILFIALTLICYLGTTARDAEPRRMPVCKYTGHPTTEAERAAMTPKPKQAVTFTSYYPDDPTGSGTVTGSGLSTEDFEINELGWFTYQGKVVIATATYECLYSSDGACAAYNDVPDDYHIRGYGSTMTLLLNGQEFEAIVLDSCGASFWDESTQRVDIYVAAPEYSIGKVSGEVYV